MSPFYTKWGKLRPKAVTGVFFFKAEEPGGRLASLTLHLYARSVTRLTLNCAPARCQAMWETEGGCRWGPFPSGSSEFPDAVASSHQVPPRAATPLAYFPRGLGSVSALCRWREQGPQVTCVTAAGLPAWAEPAVECR